MSDYYRNSEEVMSVGKWIGVMIILAIPLVNIIMYVIWAFSPNTNPNLSNFCKATLLLAIIGIFISFMFAGCASMLYML
ncbi:hypothetical protein [Tissierella sp. Yu-01]|uniref:hypothetical protein n=1 Tax=Tissierella sp. Yu-01 TaxID=3035694 RepID=UPI00240DA124|nr:hypothetical protein [Tissierella sp. Yu-01]WFA07763.1 hypothetical protein P3962_08455 [Tissierella sp. Yu-01]